MTDQSLGLLLQAIIEPPSKPRQARTDFGSCSASTHRRRDEEGKEEALREGWSFSRLEYLPWKANSICISPQVSRVQDLEKAIVWEDGCHGPQRSMRPSTAECGIKGPHLPLADIQKLLRGYRRCGLSDQGRRCGKPWRCSGIVPANARAGPLAACNPRPSVPGRQIVLPI